MWLRRRQAAVWFRKVTNRSVTYTLFEDGLSATSELGMNKVQWAAFQGIMKHRDFWLLVISPAQYTLLPLAAVPQSALDLLERSIGGTRYPAKSATKRD
jgi:hypothetical protein